MLIFFDKIKNRINIRTRHLAPFILAGFNALSMLVLYMVMSTGAGDTFRSRPTTVIVFFSAVFLGGSYMLIRWIISPVERFVEKASQNPAIADSLSGEKENSASSDVQHYKRVLQKITDFLDKKEALEHFPDIHGQSRIMLGLMSRILKVAPSDSTVLITGESGVGKELIARAVVEHSKRADKPFIKVNCAAIPEGLLESELFGHEKGAFTGAVSLKQGKFEMADGGTLFLDEIGDMPLPVQAKLLRSLQEKEIQRLGSGKSIKVDLRLITATNKDLEEQVRNGLFREDLYFRINVFRLDVPPLRARKDDIPILAGFFSESAPVPKMVAPDAMKVLMDYSWPGNVRELKNVIESACLVGKTKVIQAHDLEMARDRGESMQDILYAVDPARVNDLDRWLADAEKSIIVSALMQCKGIQARAAEMLNIKQRSLWHKVKKYNIDPRDYKE